MNTLRLFALTLALVLLPAISHAQLNIPQGGTGLNAIQDNSILYKASSDIRFATSSGLQYDGTKLTVTNAVFTTATATTLCLDTCETAWPTANFDSTAVDATTWSDGTNASNIWTFDLSGTDTTITFGSDLFTLNGGLTLTTGNNFIIGTTQWNSGDALDIDVASLDTSDDDFLDVTAGGIGVGTLTDGGVLLGNGTGDLVAMSVLANGAIIVGDGTTDPVALTAFTSSTGDLIHEAGGLEADVSGYTNGLYGQLSGATADVDTIAEIETAIGGATNILTETEIDGSSELLALMDDETGTGALVFGTSPTIATAILTGKIDRNNSAVDDDDCTGEQGLWWYDTTDSAFEWCNANSGTPVVLGSGGGDSVSVNGGAVTDPNFVSTGQVSFTDTSNTITANVTDDSIVAADLDATNAEADDDIVTYDSGSGGFTFNSGPELCVAITGDAGLCDGVDNTAGGGSGLSTSTAIADTYMIYGTSASTVGAEAAFTYDDSTNTLVVDIISLGNTGTLNGLDSIDSTTETTLEAALELQSLQGAVTDSQVPNNITIDLATLASTLTITDNESTNESNAILFTANGDLDGGNLGIESDGDLFYNPSTGALSATTFLGSGASLTGIDNDNWGTTDLSVANGGTGASTLTGLLQGNGTSAFTAISDSSTVGQILRVTGASTYAWGALNLDDTDAFTGTLPSSAIEDSFLLNTGDAGTGDYDFGGAELEIPNGSDPALDTNGEIAIDDTDGALIGYIAGAEVNLASATSTVSFTIYADDDWNSETIPLWQAPPDGAITIKQVRATTMGSSGTLAMNLQERAYGSLASAGTDIMSTTTADSTGELVTSFSNAGIAANAHIVLTTNSSSAEGGTTDLVVVQIVYQRDVE